MSKIRSSIGAALIVLAATLAFAPQAARAAELIMFDDPSCVWCRRWLAEVGPGYPHTEEGRRAPLRRVFIREQARAGVALKSAVTGTPTFVLAEDGREIGRITGYPGADYFYPMLAELLQKLPRPDTPARVPGLRETRAVAE